MKNKHKIIIFFFSLILFSKTYSQDCETLLKKYRAENNLLAKSGNELSLTNSKLIKQLVAKQDSIIKLTKKITDLEKEIGALKIKLEKYKIDLSNKSSEIGRLKERIRKLNEDLQKRIYTDQEKAAMYTDLRNSTENLNIATTKLEESKKENELLNLSIIEKDKNLKLNDKVLETYASKSRDYIHSKEEEIRFEDKIYKFDDILFILNFKIGDKEFNPTKEEKEKIERLVELVSRYDDKVKIQMIIGSIEDDRKFREYREMSVKRYFFSFQEPFDLNEKNFSKRLKDTDQNYDVAILIVKR